MAFIQRERAYCVSHGGDVQGTWWQIDKLTPASPAPSSLDAVLQARKAGRPAAVAAALAWLQAGGARRDLVAHVRDHALRHAVEEHQTKHSAAAFEEASLAGPWAATLAACAFTYGYEPTFPIWAAHAATVKALSGG